MFPRVTLHPCDLKSLFYTHPRSHQHKPKFAVIYTSEAESCYPPKSLRPEASKPVSSTQVLQVASLQASGKTSTNNLTSVADKVEIPPSLGDIPELSATVSQQQTHCMPLILARVRKAQATLLPATFLNRSRVNAAVVFELLHKTQPIKIIACGDWTPMHVRVLFVLFKICCHFRTVLMSPERTKPVHCEVQLQFDCLSCSNNLKFISSHLQCFLESRSTLVI